MTSNILGNQPGPRNVLGGGVGAPQRGPGGPSNGIAPPWWWQAQNMAGGPGVGGGDPMTEGGILPAVPDASGEMTPERMAALMSPERLAAMRTDVVTPNGPVNSPPMFNPSFNGSGGNGGGGGGGGGAGAGGLFQFGVLNPAHQPLADDLNFWLSGGFTGPNAPGARGPGMSPQKQSGKKQGK